MKINQENNEFQEFYEEISENKNTKYNLFKENKVYIYSIIFYVAGLVCGSFIYKRCQNETINNIFSNNSELFIQLLINNLSIYVLILSITVLLGICLIGYPILNIIPMIIGIGEGFQISYFYCNFSVKGIGYSLLMITPFVSLFLTIIIYSISTSHKLSKSIYTKTFGDECQDASLEYKIYLKKYLIYFVLLILAAIVNTILRVLLQDIVTI